MNFAKSLNDISLYMMAFAFLVAAGLSIAQSRKKDGTAKTLKTLMTINWFFFGLSYVILVSRLYIPFVQDALHITLYRILLIADVIALGSVFLYISIKYAAKLPKFSLAMKIFGLVQAIGLTILVIFDPGFSIKQTSLYVEIVPSFSCQIGISLSMVILSIALVITTILLGQASKKNANIGKMEKVTERRDTLLLALFVFLMIVHIPLPLIVGYELMGSLTIFIFRVLISTTILSHTFATK